MGRRAYLNRLALGRSPYEAPEPTAETSTGLVSPGQRRSSPLHADEYVQHYDERGHPVNPESKTFGRDLRRAKNDILSTMGIVVSEDANRERNEVLKYNALVTENDYGTMMEIIDRLLVPLCWSWTAALTRRIQTFRIYSYVPLTRIISYERASLGVAGFYFPGFRARVMAILLAYPGSALDSFISGTLPPPRNFFPNDDAVSKLVRAFFRILHYAIRAASLVVAIQLQSYCLLQTLHLIPPTSRPSLAYFTPFGEFASMLLPNFPRDFSFSSLSGFVLNALKAPSMFIFSFYIRPKFDNRLHQLICRQIWKAKIADNTSRQVALENSLVKWLPSLGIQDAEETQRSNLSLLDDVLFELDALRRWISSKITFKSRRASVVSRTGLQPRLAYHPEDQPLDVEQQHRRLRSAQLDPNTQTMPVRRSDAHSEGADSSLSNEENHVPDTDNMDLLRRARNLTLSTRTSPDPEARHHAGSIRNESRRHSRSDTLLSRSPSPASSQSSPRVRAQLISNSNATALQLELENRHTHIPDSATDSAAPQNADGDAIAHRTATDLLDTIISDHSQNNGTMVTYSDDISSMAAAVSSIPPTSNQPNGITMDQNADGHAMEPTISSTVNILPDAVEEPTLDDTTNHIPEPQPAQDDEGAEDAESSIFPHFTDSTTDRQNSSAGTATATATTSTPTYRVTTLSAFATASLATHLTKIVTTCLFAPLESLYLRSLANTYLAARGAPQLLRAEVYSVGAWGGGPSGLDKFAYMSQLALIYGIRGAVMTSVWGIFSGSAIWMGRRWFDWGSL